MGWNMEKSALIRLREARDAMSQTESTVADYVLGHPEETVEMSIHDLAGKTYTSSSTIVRMCRRIGFEGFKDFRKALTYEMSLRKREFMNKGNDISRNDTTEEIVEKITYKNIVVLEATKNLIDIPTLEKCVELIQKAHSVLLFGMGASLCAARDAHLKFLRLNKPCCLNDDWHSQLLQARNSRADDLAIVISYSGATEEVIACMQALRENKTPILAITRCVRSPVYELADYRLYTPSNESVFRSGAMSSRVSQLNVIDILYTAFANSEYDYAMEQLAKTHIQKPFKE